MREFLLYWYQVPGLYYRAERILPSIPCRPRICSTDSEQFFSKIVLYIDLILHLSISYRDRYRMYVYMALIYRIYTRVYIYIYIELGSSFDIHHQSPVRKIMYSCSTFAQCECLIHTVPKERDPFRDGSSDRPTDRPTGVHQRTQADDNYKSPAARARVPSDNDTISTTTMMYYSGGP